MRGSLGSGGLICLGPARFGRLRRSEFAPDTIVQYFQGTNTHGHPDRRVIRPLEGDISGPIIVDADETRDSLEVLTHP